MTALQQPPAGKEGLSPPVSVAHVSSAVRCYPGDELTLHTRVRIGRGLSSFVLTLSLPDGLIPGATRAPDDALPQLALGEGVRHLVWRVDGLPGEDSYEYEVDVRVAAARQDLALTTRAVVTAADPDGVRREAREAATIAVSAKGSYVRHLPALYQRDELMGRFLMLFESFWRPIEQRIAHMHLYFDPLVAPSELLSWLASWLGIVFDAQLTDAQRRELIRSAASLYRRRGTRQGLIDYLAIVGEHVRVIEHCAHNLVLGQAGLLGPGNALGTQNVPHTFTVVLDSAPSPSMDAARAEQRLRRIRAAIEAEKPAHTGYFLRHQAQARTPHMEG